MPVVGSDGGHVGTVGKVEEDRIKLTKKDDPDGSGQHHHYLPVSAVASVDGGAVRLITPADWAKALATIIDDSVTSAGISPTVAASKFTISTGAVGGVPYLSVAYT
jgi:hypothetical protein